jgi:hypothetical protein
MEPAITIQRRDLDMRYPYDGRRTATGMNLSGRTALGRQSDASRRRQAVA